MRHRRADGRSPMVLEALEGRRLLATVLVSSSQDVVDGDYSLGELSMREAVELANASFGEDRIRFWSELVYARIDTDLTITDAVIIEGIDENGRWTGFRIEDGDGRLMIDDGDDSRSTDVTIDGMRTVVRSFSDATRVVSRENLTFINGQMGGEPHTEFQQNSATIHHTGTTPDSYLVVRASWFRYTTVAAAGGSVYSTGAARVTIDSCEFYRTEGGAVAIEGAASVTVVNSTFSDAVGRSSARAGAVYLDLPSGIATIANSTFFRNRSRDSGPEPRAGGVLVVAGELTLTSTILTHNLVKGDANEPSEVVLGPDARLESEGSTDNLILDAATAAGLIDGTNGNILGRFAGLDALSDNGGPTRTHALLSGSPAIGAGNNDLELQFDQRGSGFSRTVGAADIGSYEWGVRVADDPTLAGTATGDLGRGLELALSHVIDGWIVLSGEADDWRSDPLGDIGGGESPLGPPVLWRDPLTGLLRLAGPTEDGFLLLTRHDGSSWSVVDLGTSAGAAPVEIPTNSLTQFQTRAGLTLIAGYNGAGDLVAFHQTGSDSDEAWSFVNISDDLSDQGMETPRLSELVGYATPWDVWNLAGVDASGDIQTVWLNPRAFDMWRVDNLSSLTGAPEIAGQLTVTQTAWKAINLGGLDAAGRLLVTWWVPGGRWVASDLTAAAGGGAFSDGHVTGFVTPWGAINYAGVTAEGDLVALWWTARTGWLASPLSEAEFSPAGPLLSHVSEGGELSIVGAADEGEVVRLWWRSGEGSAWRFQNISELVG